MTPRVITATGELLAVAIEEIEALEARLVQCATEFRDVRTMLMRARHRAASYEMTIAAEQKQLRSVRQPRRGKLGRLQHGAQR